MLPQSAPQIVSFSDITKTFENGTVALQDLSLEIRQGEFVSLLGPSGCGKSTALRLLAGLSEPNSGRLNWADDTMSVPDHDLSFVFQEPTLMPWATVFENVRLPLKVRGIGKVEARGRVMSALELVGLERFEKSYPRELSGGMKMRVSIARALVTEPKVLLMDEPFAALDEITRFKLNNELLEFWSKFGLTVVFVTHSVFESVYLSSRILIMTSGPGRIVADLPMTAPYPRDDDFRTSAEYADTCRRVSHALKDAMAA
ncbi:ABC transporter ATP-binding protein [Roseibium denhamense]|uniref:NitT/TauT family transport system ATP-binding protein n=1 Tax=Roseibium denhamense TaxID=76305 RepID=A0ABY1PIG1_9HYPH|nr:ABC transporter ATP-binding protein [Roseibium denhamense]MTI05537.1 ABC transporter ATP-binding protein [Roseibium denhamense]SMP35140.1 NitT/TauT family transport system ATP-binding protein [Roseibium denhamense]